MGSNPTADNVFVFVAKGYVRYSSFCFYCLQIPIPFANAAIAQLGERQTEDLEVPGSIPGLGTYIFFSTTNQLQPYNVVIGLRLGTAIYVTLWPSG